MSDSLTNEADLVVGIGAGRALDHAKLVATRKNLPLVQVPTVVSTGAIIHGFVADWDGRQIVGTLAEIDCKYVLVDYGVVKKAPERLNTAGMGDVLCGYAGISEWRYNAAKGVTGLQMARNLLAGSNPSSGNGSTSTTATVTSDADQAASTTA